MKPVLDACCGSRMFWFDRREETVFLVFTKPSIFTIQAAESKKKDN